MSDLALVVLSDSVYCLRWDEQDSWQCKLNGESALGLATRPAKVLPLLVDELHDAVTLGVSGLHMLYAADPAARDWTREMLALAQEQDFGSVQLLALEPLVARTIAWDASAPAEVSPTPEWCLSHLLPMLDEMFRTPATRQDNSSEALEHCQRQIEMLERSIADLRRRNEELTQQHAAARKGDLNQIAKLNMEIERLSGPPPVAQLIRFMPLFYRHFWEKIRPDEMAQLLGMSEVPDIPAPFMEPGGAVLASMRKQFLAQPAMVRACVRKLVADLQINWEVRAEMLSLLEDA